MNISSYSGGGSLRPLNPGLQQHFQGCIDLHGQSIPHGLLFAPGPDECLVCTCVNGSAGLCRTVLCAPPHNCQSLRVGDQCCQWICLDDIHPHGGSNFDVTNGGNGGNVSDVKLRLIASAVTAVLSVALLFFLIYRLRKKKLRNSSNNNMESGVGGGNGDGDEMSVGDSVMAVEQQPQHSRTHWLSWWKPTHSNSMFDNRPAPPSYDDAMMARNDLAGNGNDSSSSLDSDGSSEAPPYSEIHLDPVIPDWYAGHLRQQQQQPSFSYLQHADLLRELQQQQQPRRSDSSRRMLRSGEAAEVELRRSSSRTLPMPQQVLDLPNLPPALRRMRARSREGIVVLPQQQQERETVMQRFSLQLNLATGSSSSLSTPSTLSPRERRMRNRSFGGAVGTPSSSSSAAEHC